ncbi:retinol dehydrogenase 8-like [Latimeria chalumnae]|uniref:retinol dehydrogenase 8-like n=1 Tax=Latimeria chalumnae TaxID=7897 RepID=UPI00313EC778
MPCRSVLITGCSSGIGLALAVRLAKDELKRFKVIATMRNLEKRWELEKAAGNVLNTTLEVKELDVCSEESIRDCVNSIPGRKVDIVVSNAGVGLIGPVESQSIDTMKSLFDTNFFGLVRVVREVLPDMKRRQEGHLVVMSSVMGLQGLLFNDVYAASKFAVEGFCESMAVEALRFNINISLIEPGPVITEFEKKLYDEAASIDLSSVDRETARIFREIYLPYSRRIFTALGQTPEEIAKHTMKVITADKPPFRYQTNSVYTPMTALKHADLSGKLALDTFYKIIFQHDRVFSASLALLNLLRGRSRKGGAPGGTS